MESVSNFLQQILDTIGAYLPTVLAALIVLIVGWLLIELVCRGLATLLSSLKIDQRMQGKPEDAQDREDAPVKVERVLVLTIRYVLLISLFLLVLSILGVTEALDPVRDMFSQFFSAIPNIIAALLIAILGYILAQIVSSLVEVLLKGVDKYNTKLGLHQGFSLSRLLGQLVFITVFIPILIIAFEALRIEAIAGPATAMLNAFLGAIPNIVGAALILAVAFFVGRFITNLLAELLKSMGCDDVPVKMGLGHTLQGWRCSKMIADVVLVFIMLGAAVSASELLGLQRLAVLLAGLTEFAAQVALGLVVLFLGTALANVAYKALTNSGTGVFLASLARIAIIGLVVAMGLHSMGIANDIVRLAFGLTIGALAVAFALAFGLGGREAAGKQVELWFNKLNSEGKTRAKPTAETKTPPSGPGTTTGQMP